MAKVTSQPSPSSEVPAPAPALPAPALPSPALLLRALRLHPALPRSCAARRAGTALPACPGPGDGRGEAVHCFSRQHARRQVIVLQFIWYNNHSHVLVPGAGTDPRCRAAAWSMMPSPVSGDARDPPPQGAGRGWQPSPPHCTPGAGPATCIGLTHTLHSCSRGSSSCQPGTEGWLCSARCWGTPVGRVLEGIVLKFKGAGNTEIHVST